MDCFSKTLIYYTVEINWDYVKKQVDLQIFVFISLRINNASCFWYQVFSPLAEIIFKMHFGIDSTNVLCT